MQELWNQFGEINFEISVILVLKYEDPNADYTEKLEEMLKQCLDLNNCTRRM